MSALHQEGPMCGHPEMHLLPGQVKPAPARMVGFCEHNLACPVCGWGWGQMPDPCCPATPLPLVLS